MIKEKLPVTTLYISMAKVCRYLMCIGSYREVIQK